MKKSRYGQNAHGQKPNAKVQRINEIQTFWLIILGISEKIVILQQNEENERTRYTKSRCIYGAGAADV
jgi:hypothetical protein